jgi:Na+-transporting NADH:ubiquinone oxidoreductase subunit NqrB
MTPEFRSDPRNFQIAFLSIFLATGLSFLEWTLPLTHLLSAFAGCLMVQSLFIRQKLAAPSSIKSALISAFSICLMLRSDRWEIVLLAAVLSISSKFIFRSAGRHFFNPTNFGICMTILITGQAWVSPGLWGSEGHWWLLIGLLGFVVCGAASRTETGLSFLIVFAGLHAWRGLLVLGWPADHFLHQLNSGTLLLFSFFMITDPASTPRHRTARMVWAGLTGYLAFYLQAFQWINGAPLWALFFMSTLSPLFDLAYQRLSTIIIHPHFKNQI